MHYLSKSVITHATTPIAATLANRETHLRRPRAATSESKRPVMIKGTLTDTSAQRIGLSIGGHGARRVAVAHNRLNAPSTAAIWSTEIPRDVDGFGRLS
jgi:hypothetical protein